MFEGRISDVYIIGGAKELESFVSDVDARVQKMSQSTEDIKGFILRKGSNFAGNQFQMAADEISKLSDVLYRESVNINRAQQDLVKYINRVNWFNDRSPSNISPRSHTVERTNISMDVENDIMTGEDVLQLINRINEYCREISDANKNLATSKEDISRIWKDSQAKQYMIFIDSVDQNIEEGVKALTSYKDELVHVYNEFYNKT